MLLKENDMIKYSSDRHLEDRKLEEDFGLAFKLVFFDENDNELDPPQYKELSTFSIEKNSSKEI